MHRGHRGTLFSVFALLLTCGVMSPAPALAYEDQLTLEVGAGYAAAQGADTPAHGLAAELLLSYGLDDTFTLRAFGAYAMHPATDHLITGGADLVYMLDVLSVVPYLGLGVDALGIARTDVATRAAFGVHATFGLDYLLSRTLYIGIEARPTYVITGARFLEIPVYVKLGFAFDI